MSQQKNIEISISLTLSLFNRVIITLKNPQRFYSFWPKNNKKFIIIDVRNPDYFIKVMNGILNEYRSKQNNPVKEENNKLLFSKNMKEIITKKGVDSHAKNKYT